MNRSFFKDKVKMAIERCRPFYRASRYFYTLLCHPERLPVRKCFGDRNPGETVFVIRPNSEDGVQGLMSLFVQTMQWIDYAKRKHYLPYVDFKSFQTQYSDGNNVWEYFFSQPSRLTYDEVYQSRSVRFSGPMLFDDVDYRLYEKDIFTDSALCARCCDLIWDNIRLSDEAEALADAEGAALDIQNCIGVFIRGTDYTALKPSGEFVQPTIEMVVEKIDEYLHRMPDAHIFLVTEDAANYEALRRIYGEKLLITSYDHFLSNYDGKDFLSKSHVLTEDKKKRGMEYLVKILLLSRCSCLISSITRGSISAYAMNGNRYNSSYIFDLGLYP